MMKYKFIQLVGSLFMILTLSACVTTGGAPQGQVAMLDTSERSHLDNTLNMTDLMALAEKLTEKMLVSNAVAEWGEKRPRLIVADLINETDDDNIPEEMIYDRIKGIILESGVARIMNKNSKADYILRGVLSSTQAGNNQGDHVREFRVTLTLSSFEGEDFGNWDGRINLAKSGGRPLF